ncbi:MAG: hypothetical protein ACR2NT_03450 [Acidimicrobiia bacterium]
MLCLRDCALGVRHGTLGVGYSAVRLRQRPLGISDPAFGISDPAFGISPATACRDHLLTTGDSFPFSLVESLLVFSVVLSNLSEIELSLLDIENGLTNIEPRGVVVLIGLSQRLTSLKNPKLGLLLGERASSYLVVEIL